MIYEFQGFRLDGRRRELRLRGREIPLQPRVFDVLSYLVAHRDRVVSKDELLDAVWPDVVVSDGSLKRAVSLVRSALREGGAEDAIRTYSRQGYRFCVEDLSEEADEASAALPEPLARARAAYDEQRWGDAVRAFVEADGVEGLEASDLDRWAEAAQLAGRPSDAIAPLERSVAAHGAANDCRGAARAALGLALIHYERMEFSVGKGWLRRAATMLPDEPVTREHGWLPALASRYAVAEGDFEESVRAAERAIEIGRRLEDVDIELLAMSYLGISLVALGEVERGIAIHDEAAATVLSGTASPLVGGLV